MTPAKRHGSGRANGGGRGVVLANRYRLEARVAAGGMGEVWRATDLVLQRTVAVKLLRESLAEDPVLAERFRREALLAASVSHPNMADVFDYVQEQGRPGIVMAFVHGETLGERIAREGPLEVGDAVRIACALLAVLQVAHDAGIVHRDVKPPNVMLTATGEVKVTDFGIARSAGHQTLTETGMVVGTAHYLSPEQVSGQPATPASDLYAVGAILYEMLTGGRPFQAETPIAVAMLRLTEDPVLPRRIRPDIPEPVEQVVMRALSRDPAQRYASADGMRAALESALASAQPVTEGRLAGPEPTRVLPLGDVPALAGQTATVARRAEPATPPIPARAAATGRRRRGYGKAIALAALVLGVVALLAVLLLKLAAGPTTVGVPALVGQPLAQADRLAADRGLKISFKTVQSSRPKDLVLGQDPRAGIRIERGETVFLTVSSGTPPQPPDIVIPNLQGLSLADAEKALGRLGVGIGDVIKQASKDVNPGEVVGTSPPAGSTVKPGDKVDIVVAKEPKKEHGNSQEGN